MVTIPQSRRWSRQRGAALVESVVVVPAFIVLLAGSIFLHEVVSDTLHTMRTARNDSWTLAMQGCQSGTGAPSEFLKFNSQMPTAPGSDRSLTNTSGGALKSASTTARVSLAGSAGGQGGAEFVQAVSSHAHVWCNDRTESGTVVGVFKWLIDPLTH
jgi:hypothetical protein